MISPSLPLSHFTFVHRFTYRFTSLVPLRLIFFDYLEVWELETSKHQKKTVPVGLGFSWFHSWLFLDIATSARIYIAFGIWDHSIAQQSPFETCSWQPRRTESPEPVFTFVQSWTLSQIHTKSCGPMDLRIFANLPQLGVHTTARPSG